MTHNLAISSLKNMAYGGSPNRPGLVKRKPLVTGIVKQLAAFWTFIHIIYNRGRNRNCSFFGRKIIHELPVLSHHHNETAFVADFGMSGFLKLMENREFDSSSRHSVMEACRRTPVPAPTCNRACRNMGKRFGRGRPPRQLPE